MLLPAVLATVICTAGYWILLSRRTGRPALPSVSLSALVAAILAVLGFLEHLSQPTRAYVPRQAPMAIAMAFDLSLSMLARPDPRTHPEVPTRLDRAKATLLEVLRMLQDRRQASMVSVTVFTTTSEIVLAWDDSLPQVGEVVEHVIAPDLLTRPGTDLGFALVALTRRFQTLPRGEGAPGRKVAILVSDGEQTVTGLDLQRAVDRLRAQDVDLVALHVGLLDVPEGIPRFDPDGAFLGFRQVGGRFYTVPDPATMTLIPGPDPRRGLYVRAEDPQAATKIVEFLGAAEARPDPGARLQLLAVWGLWGLSLVLLARTV